MKTQQLKSPPLLQLHDTAIRAAHAAGRALLKRFRTKLQISEKPGAGIVTNADLEAERAALTVLKKAFPDFGILTEEAGVRESQSPGRWILDPLDGTTNFAHGLPMFCVSIAAEWNGKVVAGVIYHPTAKETYSAIRGKGAFVNGQKLKGSGTKDIRKSFLSTGFTSRKDLWLKKEMEPFERLSQKAGAIRRPGSAALDLAYVARGVFDGFWERGLSPWDVAAGVLLIEEAGGKVTDFNGKPFQLECREILASNGRLHRTLVKEIS